MNLNIREMSSFDIENVSIIHEKSFERQTKSLEWITCNFNAYPRIQYYVADIEGRLVGYIQWIQKSGFRSKVILELEQMAVLPEFRNKGIGKSLISKSLPLIKHHLEINDAKLKHVIVTTRADNNAQDLYSKVLGAKVVATISSLYSADEVIMVSREVR